MLGAFEPESWFKAVRSQNAANTLLNLSGEDWEHLAVLLYQALKIGSANQSEIGTPATLIWNLTKQMRALKSSFEKAGDAEIRETVDPHRRRHMLVGLLEAMIALYESPDDGLPKAGQDVRFYPSLLLDAAREFVRERLGTYADGDIQELLTQIEPSMVLEADALRKKVERFRSSYPRPHEVALIQAAKPKAQSGFNVVHVSGRAAPGQRQFGLTPPSWFYGTHFKTRMRSLDTARSEFV